MKIQKKLKSKLFEQKQYVPMFSQFIKESEEMEDVKLQHEYEPGKDDEDEYGGAAEDSGDLDEEKDMEENDGETEDMPLEEDGGNPTEGVGSVSAVATKFFNGLSKGKLGVTAEVASKSNAYVKSSGVASDNALVVRGGGAKDFALPGMVIIPLDGSADKAGDPQTIKDDTVAVATKDAANSAWVKLTVGDLKSAMANSDPKTWFANLAKAPKAA
jgi:hypothetical protein